MVVQVHLNLSLSSFLSFRTIAHTLANATNTNGCSAKFEIGTMLPFYTTKQQLRERKRKSKNEEERKEEQVLLDKQFESKQNLRKEAFSTENNARESARDDLSLMPHEHNYET